MLEWCADNGGELSNETAQGLAESVFKEFPDETRGMIAQEVLKSLEERHFFRCTEEAAVCYLYPYSAYKTDYLVTLEDGRQFFAMCAIDAMGSAVTFSQSVKIQSCCKDTKEEIQLLVDPEKGLVEVQPDYNIIATYYDVMKNYIEFNC